MSVITAAELKSLTDAQPAVPLLDVRTPAEFAEIHVPGAVNVPLDQLTPAAVEQHFPSAATAPFYVLCRSGARATQAATQLIAAGIPHGVVVQGGTLAWKAAGFPVITGPRRVMSLERQVRIGAGSLVLLGLALGWWLHPAFLLLSAFVGAGLVFAGLTDWCGLGLLLAKAPWNRTR